jgi:hypothetical protein
MRGDAVGAGGQRHLRGAHRVRAGAAARIAKRRDVIDVDAKSYFAQRLDIAHPITLSTLLTIAIERRRDNMSVRCFRSNTWISRIISRKSGDFLLNLTSSILAPCSGAGDDEFRHVLPGERLHGVHVDAANWRALNFFARNKKFL